MKNKATMAKLEELVERHYQARQELNRAGLQIRAHLNEHLKTAKGAKGEKLFALIAKLQGHA
jgi:hypothetical protein